ncbi:MAG: hypothetical protein KKD38_02485 [Candidatus Delongbacteria bacterium]|nr:hypothetical protein [Candidatus Delongbacteria bacterium]MCG2761040.1 hypothetical protein [Candidatus Delongbacteria bacterium]
MKKVAFLILMFYVFVLNCKVPFNTLYIEIEKIRYEGDAELIRNAEDNSDMLKTYKSTQKIWVNVPENSYLMIEEPGEENDLIEKHGKLKYKDRHYTLDYGLMFAWDGTDIESEQIYDNYTSKVPNYVFYKAKLAKKVRISTSDNIKRKAHVYAYLILDPADEDQTNAYIDEIEKSDLPKEDKDSEIQAARDALEKKAVKYFEWIWVDDENNELQMFLKKTETTGKTKTEYNTVKLVVDKDFDYKIFETTLSEFKVKQVKG